MSASASTPASMSARKVKFVASDPNRGGLPVKRKQVQQACVSCRRKKVSNQPRLIQSDEMTFDPHCCLGFGLSIHCLMAGSSHR